MWALKQYNPQIEYIPSAYEVRAMHSVLCKATQIILFATDTSTNGKGQNGKHISNDTNGLNRDMEI